MESTRRTFLKQTAALSAGCLAGIEGTQSRLCVQFTHGRNGDRPAQQAGWYSRPMRWAQLSFVEDDPGQLRSAVLAGLLQKNPRRRHHFERGRMRCLLSHRDSYALSQQVAREYETHLGTLPRVAARLA